eukprot:8247404-Heterocapsa_arctica.AAC.1
MKLESGEVLVQEKLKFLPYNLELNGDEEEGIDVVSRLHEMPPMALEESQRSEVKLEDQRWKSEILSVNEDRKTYATNYLGDADEKEDVEVYRCVQEPKIELADLKVGQKFKGKVVSVVLFGGFINKVFKNIRKDGLE